MPSQNYYVCEDLTLNQNEFTRTGFRFANWATKEDGSGLSIEDQGLVPGVTYTELSAIGVVNNQITLYAQWEEVPTFTITWVDGNGDTLKTEQVPYGTTPSYTGETPTKTATSQYTYTR